MAVSIYKDEYIVRVYQLAQQGLTETKISKILGISVATFRVWEKKKKAFKKALEMGRKEGNPNNKDIVTFQDYVYKRLPRKLRKLWNEINAFGTSVSGIEKIEALLIKRGVRARQHLFLYAWTKSNFSISYALRKVNISRSTFEGWKSKDDSFLELVDNINWHKGNFFEDHLLKLVAGGDTSAILHVNKTFNRKRGYGEKTDIDINLSGGVSISHTVKGKGFSLETRKAMLKDLRNGEEKKKTETDKT